MLRGVEEQPELVFGRQCVLTSWYSGQTYQRDLNDRVCAETDKRGKVEQGTTKQASGEHVSYARHYTSLSLSSYTFVPVTYTLSMIAALINTCATWAIVYRGSSLQQQSRNVAELSRDLLLFTIYISVHIST